MMHRRKTYEAIQLPDQIAHTVKDAAKRKGFVAFFFYIVIALWLSSQFVAWRLQFTSALADQRLWGNFYYPWAAIPWAWHFLHLSLAASLHRQLVGVFASGSVLFIVLGIGSILLAVADYRRHLNSAKPTHHLEGSAAWMGETDLGETDMLPPGHPAIAKAIVRAERNGKKISWRVNDTLEEWRRRPCVLIGEWVDANGKRHWLRDASNGHIALFAPTRSGKGSSIVVPAMFTWTKSVVVNDPKGELFALTSWYRKHVLKQRIFRIDPLCTDGSSSCINPLDWVPIGTEQEVAEAQNLAELICDPLGIGMDTGGDSDHWRKTSFAFLTGVILHVLMDPDVKDKSLTGLMQFLSSPNRSFKDTLELMTRTRHDPNGVRGWFYNNERTLTHPTVRSEAQTMINRDDRERASILSSVISYLTIYNDPIISRNIRKSDFSIPDIMRSDRPVTVYVNVTPDNMDRVRPFIRLFYNNIIKKFTGKLEFGDMGVQKPSFRFELLLLMDELTSTLGKMPILANAVTFLAGYGIKLLLVAQNLSHLAEPYGEKVAQSILANMRTHIYYANNDPDTCKRVSSMLGSGTVRIETSSWNGGKRNISENYRARPLLTDDEVRKFDENKEIVIITGKPPAKFDRINIGYEEPFFKRLQHRAVEEDGSPLRCDFIPEDQRVFTRELAILREQAQDAARQRIADANAAMSKTTASIATSARPTSGPPTAAQTSDGGVAVIDIEENEDLSDFFG